MPITTQEKTENKINDIKSDRDWMEDNEDEFFEKNVAQIEKVRHNVITEFEKKNKKNIEFSERAPLRKSRTENKISSR